jgi:hypothetical protein
MFKWEKITNAKNREAWVYDTKSYLGNVSVSWHPLVKRYQAVWDDLGISVGTSVGFFDSLEEAQEACEKDAERILQHVIEDLGYTNLDSDEIRVKKADVLIITNTEDQSVYEQNRRLATCVKLRVLVGA